jgi:hypothetical protein
MPPLGLIELVIDIAINFYGYGFSPLNSIEEPINALGFTEGIFLLHITIKPWLGTAESFFYYGIGSGKFSEFSNAV